MKLSGSDEPRTAELGDGVGGEATVTVSGSGVVSSPVRASAHDFLIRACNQGKSVAEITSSQRDPVAAIAPQTDSFGACTHELFKRSRDHVRPTAETIISHGNPVASVAS